MIKVILSDVDIEEVVRKNSRLDYYEIALSLLYTGTTYQRKCINLYMRTLHGKCRTDAIKEFIDIEIMIGRIEV